MATYHSAIDALLGIPLQSDASGGSLASPTALTAAFVASTSLDVRNFREVEWAMYVSNAGTGPVTRVDVEWEFSLVASPGANDWMLLQTESILSGVSTPSTYEIRQTISTAPFTKTWTTPVKGRWMRILVKAGAGTPTSSVIALTAMRRI
jgi:hypothetical protein